MRVVVTGASGQLGSYVLAGLRAGAHEIIAWSKATSLASSGPSLRAVELTHKEALLHAVEEADPDAVIHLAAVSSVDACQRDSDTAVAVNIEATRLLAGWAARADRRFVYTSTDLVFDGSRSWYSEDDVARPMSGYAQTKFAGEQFVLEVPNGIVVRLSLLFGPSLTGRVGFFDRALSALRSGTASAFFTDEYRTPLEYSTAAEIIGRLVASSATGILHAGGPERLSRYELMRRSAQALGFDPGLVQPNLRADVPTIEPRPADVSLDTARLTRLFTDLPRPTIEDALGSLS
jgi:dTDP-4-dehydrorhamnose reductase